MKELGIIFKMAPNKGKGEGGPGKAVRALLESAKNSTPMGEVDASAAVPGLYRSKEIAVPAVVETDISQWPGYTTHMSEDAKTRLAELGQKRLNTKVGSPNLVGTPRSAAC